MSSLKYKFFTPPYPEECLYSVISRYHVNSANPTLAVSLRELFPESSCTSLRSSVTSPYLLTFMDQWMDMDRGLTQNQLIADTTSYQLFTIIARKIPFPNELENLRKTSMQNSLVHPHRHIRYCPCCVREQYKVYGEPYWQRLPQLKGAEYCPIHGVPFLDSPVSIADIQHHAIPAVTVLDREPKVPNVQINTRLKDCYINASRDLQWLLKYGYLVRGMEHSIIMMEKALNLPPNGLWARTIETVALDHFPEQYVYDCFPRFTNTEFKYEFFSMHSLQPRQMAVLMSIASGSAEKFAQLRNGTRG